MSVNTWLVLLSIILFIIIINKIINFNKPFNEKMFIEKYKNCKRLKSKINLENFKKNIPLITSYYIGLN